MPPASPPRRYVHAHTRPATCDDIRARRATQHTNALQIRGLMDNPANIRNMSVIAHGKQHYSISTYENGY